MEFKFNRKSKLLYEHECDCKTDEDSLLNESLSSIDHITGDGTVDFLGYPASNSRTGGFWAVVCILGCQTGIMSAYYGICYNLVLYMNKVFHQDSAASTSMVTVWTGLANISCLLGAFMANGFLGDFVTSGLLYMITFVGTLLIALSATLTSLKPAPCGINPLACPGASTGQLLFLNAALWVTAIGFGFQPCVLAFGASQYDETDKDESQKKPTYFSCYYACMCLSAFISGFGFVNVEDKFGFGLGFGLVSAVVGLSLLVLFSGTPYYRYHRPRYNAFHGISKLSGWIFSHWNAKVNDYSRVLCDRATDLSKTKQLCCSSIYTGKCRILEKAASSSSEERYAKQPAKLDKLDILALSAILKLLPIWMSIILYGTIYAQMSSLFVLQGSFMNTHVGSFDIPPAMLNIADAGTVIIVIFSYEWMFVPLIARFTGKIRGISQLQRIGIGQFLGVLAMVYVAILERKRLQLVNPPEGVTASNLSVLWQIPQYSLIGASEVFAYLGHYEFFYSQAPEGAQSFGTALSFSGMALGSFLGGLFVSIVQKITSSSNGSGGWIPQDLNKGHLDYFYSVMTLVSCVNFAYFLIVASLYQYKQIQSEKITEDPSEAVNKHALCCLIAGSV